MKKNVLKYLIFFVLIISFTACKISKNTAEENKIHDKLIVDLKNNDYSKSPKEAIIFIKDLLNNPECQIITIEIYNFHGGIYEQKSKVEKRGENVIIQTSIIGMDNSKESNNRTIKISDFILQLNKLELDSENQIVLAGNYQNIYIQSNETERLFLTRKAFGLMNLL